MPLMSKKWLVGIGDFFLKIDIGYRLIYTRARRLCNDSFLCDSLKNSLTLFSSLIFANSFRYETVWQKFLSI